MFLLTSTLRVEGLDRSRLDAQRDGSPPTATLEKIRIGLVPSAVIIPINRAFLIPHQCARSRKMGCSCCFVYSTFLGTALDRIACDEPRLQSRRPNVVPPHQHPRRHADGHYLKMSHSIRVGLRPSHRNSRRLLGNWPGNRRHTQAYNPKLVDLRD